jgi:hypothetical protein
MYSIKKHLNEETPNTKIPGFNFTRDKVLSSMRKTEYEDFKQSDWAATRLGLKPNSKMRPVASNEI